MKAFALLALCFIFLLCSCKKEEQYEIIYPGSYFPVYPNSWWVYKDQDDQFTTHSVDNTYKLNSYQTGESLDHKKAYFSDPYYVPFYDGQPIYYYDRISYGNAYPFQLCYTKWPILSEQIGFTFQKEWVDHRYTFGYYKVRVKGKYFNGTDSILVQEIFVCPEHLSDIIITQEFAKNIGLERQFSCDTITNDTLSMKILIDYYVSFDSTSVEY